MRRRVLHQTVPLAAVVALLAACSGTADEEATDAEVLWGPLDRVYQDARGQSDEDYAAQIATTEEAIAACMAQAGFEYVPSTSTYTRISTEDLLTHLPSSEEYAKEYGYGVVRSPSMTDGTPQQDPNEALREGLSPEALAEYEAALFGGFASWDGTGDPPTDQGCQGDAFATQLRTEPDPLEQEVLAELSRIETEAVPSHPDVVEADGRWAACMSDAGYPGLTSHRDAQMQIWDAYLAHGGGEGEVGPDGMTDSEREFGPIEIAQATADWQCRDELGYESVVTRVRDALQQEYIDAHATELDAWVAQVQESQSE